MKKLPPLDPPKWAKHMTPSAVTVLRTGHEYVIMRWDAMPPEVPTKSYVTLWREEGGRIHHQITRTMVEAIQALPQLPL